MGTVPGPVSLFQSLAVLFSCPQWPCLAQSEVEKDHLPVTSFRPQGMGCPELCGRACLQGPERPSWLALLPQPRNPSPTSSMAGSGCWGQSSQGLCLPQAFQELSSEVTVTVLVSEENILVRASVSGNLRGSGYGCME